MSSGHDGDGRRRKRRRPPPTEAVPIAIEEMLLEASQPVDDPVEDVDPAAGRYARIHAVVRRIPPGRVSTYGRIAAQLERCGPRQVGYALAALASGSDVPWHRVINAQGRLSERRGGGGTQTQRLRLESEGVVFDARGRIDLERFGWSGRAEVSRPAETDDAWPERN